MAQVKLCRGAESSIPHEIQDGYLYVCTDSNNVFVDCYNSEGTEVRFQTNANYASKMRYINSENQQVELDAAEIIGHVLNKNNPHGLTHEQLGLYVATVSEVKSYIGI